MFFLGSFPKYLLQLFFRNAYEWELEILKKHFFVQHEWMPLDWWKEDIREMSIVAKWYWCQINKHKGCTGHVLLFQKHLVKEKYNLPMLIPRCQYQDFQMAFKMCSINNHSNVTQKLKRNDRYSSKQDRVREKHLNKQIVQGLQVLKNVY